MLLGRECRSGLINAEFQIVLDPGFELGLNSREWATLIWLVALFLFCLSKPALRASLSRVVAAASSPKILGPIVALVAWVALEVELGARAGVWNSDLLKGTVIWILVDGVVLLANFDEATVGPRFFRDRVRGLIRGTVFVELFLNLWTLGFLVELLLQPVLFVLVVGPALADTGGQSANDVARTRRVFTCCLSWLVLGLLSFSAWQTYVHWKEMDARALGLDLLLPVWLTVGVLPYVFGVAVYATYESIYHRSAIYDSRRWRRIRATALAFAAFRLGLREASALGTYWLGQLVTSSDIRSACRAIERFRRGQEERKRRDEEERNRLERHAGSDEIDGEGRRLDRREFKEAMHTLRWLSTCQMGWYRRRGGMYHPGLLEFALDGEGGGLPSDAEITMDVAEDGQAWFAWYRTVSGWCFAIGAAGPPPETWEYDGPEPPLGFPGRDSSWGSGPFREEVNKNWG